MCQHNLDQVPHFKWVDSWTQVPGFLWILKQLESFKGNTYLTLSRLLHNFRIYMNDANVTITNTVLIMMILMWIGVHYMPHNAKQFSYIILGLRIAKQENGH